MAVPSRGSINRICLRPAIVGRVIPAAARRGTGRGRTRMDTTPDNHVVSRPNHSMRISGAGRVSSSDRSPTVRNRIVSVATVVSDIRVVSAPYNHFRTGPNCTVSCSGEGSWAGFGPGISAGRRRRGRRRWYRCAWRRRWQWCGRSGCRGRSRRGSGWVRLRVWAPLSLSRLGRVKILIGQA
jgi:hypothetical protein